MTIMPCFGKGELLIKKNPDSNIPYLVSNSNKMESAAFKEQAELFNYFNEQCKSNQHYILQDTNFLYQKDALITELLVTVQRDLHSIWWVTDLLDQKDIRIQLSEKTLGKVCEIAIEAADCLVGDAPNHQTVVLDIGIVNEQMWIKDIELHFPKSKWNQYQLFSSLPELAPCLPHTQLATTDTFLPFIKKHRQIMLKPCHGQWGLGIAQVTWIKDEVFEVHHERLTRTICSENEILDYLQTEYLSKDCYIFQNKIPLATIDDSIFDARVMVQREGNASDWEITARVAKVAVDHFIVSNVAKSILQLDEALGKTALENVQKLISELDKVCLICAQVLGEFYSETTCIGMDIGIDNQGGIWILEANLVPDLSLFERLADKSIRKKIIDKMKTRERLQ